MRIWARAKQHDGVGNWDKILKRLYRFAAIAKRRFLRARAKKDILANPALTARIADYMRCTGTVSAYIAFVREVWSDERQVYGDVNLILIESLLRLEPTAAERPQLRELGTQLLRQEFKYPGATECMAVGPLLLLRFGDRRSLPLLKTSFEQASDNLPAAAVRACAIVFASYGRTEARELKTVASKLLRNHLSEMVKMLDSVATYTSVPPRFVPRVDAGLDAVARQLYIDMRGLVIARLIGLNTHPNVRAWLADRRRVLEAKALSLYDRDLLQRLWPK
jgi:hypothetical protein